MKAEHAQRLSGLFSVLLRIAENPTESFVFECEDGWVELIRETLQQLEMLRTATSPDLRVVQVKEKFGTLRCYTRGGAESDRERIRSITEWAFERSAQICERCGTKDNVTTELGGWVQSLCPPCRQLRMDRA